MCKNGLMCLLSRLKIGSYSVPDGQLSFWTLFFDSLIRPWVPDSNFSIAAENRLSS